MSTGRLRQSFTIHPVGQGLFYSCNISRQEQVTFRMVFDCGSKTAGAGQEEVALYRDPDFLAKKKLDLLVISHFDSDHVNHIGRLLNDDIKIKRLVMPFITFEERLYLVLDMLRERGFYRDDDDFAVKVILDPLTTLAGNFDEGFEGYIIQSDPGEPVKGSERSGNSERSQEEDGRVTFDFPDYATQPAATGQDLIIPANLQESIKSVKDSRPGHASAPGTRLYIMDFLFYRKSFGEKDIVFYEEVKLAFLKWKKIDDSLSPEEFIAAVCESIKTIRSATEIKKLFKAAAKTAGFKAGKGADITNLNTTALCLLHRNLNLVDYAAGGRFEPENEYQKERLQIDRLQKFLADHSSRVRINDPELLVHHIWHDRYWSTVLSQFPNTMLTSDSFLLTAEDVKAFLNKYRDYYPDFWLIQIPHHGSKENSDAVLHSNIPTGKKSFINYGTQNTHSHPSDSVILSLVTSSLSTRLVPVNEYQGFEFALDVFVDSK